MARISGIDLPKNKRIDVALTYIYGIGQKLSSRILAEAKVDPTVRVHNLSEAEVHRITESTLRLGIKVEGDLRKEIQTDIKRLAEIGCYRGLRHRRNLPVRGQRTRSNARTRKGPRKTVGAKAKVE